ncbi:hypothetical protein PQQ86_36340 [Paraburkholderia sediminicola]|uniref:lysozyme inhibitor LprI family protein n=1 Tax=Paraburkholderia sediminicola TaxID=458836 RepID=UPI0038B84031
MIRTKIIFIFYALLFLLCSDVWAKDIYTLVGMAPINKANLSATPKLALPINLSASSTIEIGNGHIIFHHYGTSSGACSISISENLSADKWPIDFYENGIFDNRKQLDRFLEDKFHTNSKDWNSFYLIGRLNSPSKSPNCIDAPGPATMHASNNELILVDLPYVYLFKQMTDPFRDPTESFDCSKARTSVEHLICGNPDLLKLDAIVNRGFVGMQMRHSREISYQDPVRVNQTYWLSHERNKCTTVECLSAAYKARIQYIKGQISDEFPSYPAEEPYQESD